MKLLGKILLLFNSLYGYWVKYCIDLGFLKVPSLNNETGNVIVSLTSYGRRVEKGIVFYTIVSLLRQELQPKRIILWLSETEWNDVTLPLKIKKLREKGVEIRYCADLRSYKKLIPTLNLYPTENILTVDDDVIYSSDTIKCAVLESKNHPSDIICFNALKPIIVGGIPQKYYQWQSLNVGAASKLIFPVGVGGILYPPGSLYSDVLSYELFKKLCPIADDIWFWYNGLRNNTIKRFVHKKGRDLSFDILYQYFHKGSALTHINRNEHQNDKQFFNLFEYYKLKISDQGELFEEK